jgi:hypothetical protein
MTLRDVLQQAAREQPDAWLYLPGECSQWTLDTEAFLLSPEFDPQTDEPMLPDEIVQRGLRETLDTRTITDCVQWADRLTGRPDDAVRMAPMQTRRMHQRLRPAQRLLQASPL